MCDSDPDLRVPEKSPHPLDVVMRHMHIMPMPEYDYFQQGNSVEDSRLEYTVVHLYMFYSNLHLLFY
jgi:hypothetical protein